MRSHAHTSRRLPKDARAPVGAGSRKPHLARQGITQVEFLVLLVSICLAATISWHTFGRILRRIIEG